MNLNKEDVIEYIGKDFYNFENESECLFYGWNSNRNIIFYGEGGYGKSEGAMLFGKYLKEKGLISTDPFILSFNQGTTEDKIFGGMDVKKFQDEGAINYLLEKSFIEHEYVIFEELWDAFPQVLLALKDALTSGYIRSGDQMVKIKTKMIVCCTNRSRDEVISDDSTEALMQRFLLQYNVYWGSHNLNDYVNLFKKKNLYNDNTHLLCEIILKVNRKVLNDESILTKLISPRTAVQAAHQMNTNGFNSLRFIPGFDSSILNDFKSKISLNEKNLNNVKKLADSGLNILDSFKKLKNLSIKDRKKKVVSIIKKIDSIPASVDITFQMRLNMMNVLKHICCNVINNIEDESFTISSSLNSFYDDFSKIKVENLSSIEKLNIIFENYFNYNT